MSYVLINCVEFEPTFDFFTKLLNFKIKSIFPADKPSTAILVGYSISIKLACNGKLDGTSLIILCDDISQFFGIKGANVEGSALLCSLPNGTKVKLTASNEDIDIPPLNEAFVLNINSQSHDKESQDGTWTVGRAGMRYRDLIPCRLGGRFIASHIHIPNEGPVPDYVHYHKVRFQIIFCFKGWVRVVYEDQGDSFVLRAGDCVVQPPQIRHRVLECGPDLEVVEIGCPAIHETLAEFDLTLPTGRNLPERVFDGQRFVRHESDTCPWTPSSEWTDSTGCPWEVKRTGIGEATNIGDVKILRPIMGFGDTVCSAEGKLVQHQGEFFFVFVLSGSCEFVTSGDCFEDGNVRSVTNSLGNTDAVTIPAGMHFSFRCCSNDLQLLVVSCPHDLVLTPSK